MLGTLLGPGCFLAALFDVFENAGLFMLLISGESKRRDRVDTAHAEWGSTTFTCVCIKFTLLGAAVLYVLAAAVAAVSGSPTRRAKTE